ncbi:tyrosine-type recombinase/integrase [Bacillus sp. NPDC077411]|uniref:tyrosine-type recombinase/integrase n=1 Tax=Bacillus sp. NPDC077411 TaxID=3363947 RepID=UPI0037C8D6F4
MTDLTTSTSRRFIQDQVINYKVKPRALHRRISCLKSFSQYCLKENYISIDFMGGILAPKTENKLPVYMTLQELKKLFTFLENDNRPLSYRNHLLFKLLATSGMLRQEFVGKSGLSANRFSLHHLRHTFATLMLQENKDQVDLRTLQEMLGHESLATASMYTHVDFEQKKKAINSFLTN